MQARIFGGWFDIEAEEFGGAVVESVWSGENIAKAFARAMAEPEFREHFLDELGWMLSAAADFVASHDPSTKARLSEAEAPFCRDCECDHVPGEHVL